MSNAGDNADFLVYKEIIISPFPRKYPRTKLYEFMDKHWDNILIFMKYIDKRQDNENIYGPGF